MSENNGCKGGCFSRREAIEVLTKMGVAAATIGLVTACGSDSDDSKGTDTSTKDSVTIDNGVATLVLSDYPNLKSVNGSYRLTLNGKPVSVTRIDADKVVAVVAICTHQGATLGELKDGAFVCPRHGAKFTPSGTASWGPTTTSLTIYTSTIASDKITVDVPS